MAIQRRRVEGTAHDLESGNGEALTKQRRVSVFRRYCNTCALLWLLGSMVILSWMRRSHEDTVLRLGAEQLRAACMQGGCDRELIPILMPVYGRPEYLKRVLAGLKRVASAQRSVLVISQDGSNEQITTLVQSSLSAMPMPVIWLRHERPYFGVPSWFLRSDYTTAANIFFLLRFAFEHANATAAITLESDLVPSVDFYEYFRWAHGAVRANETLRRRTLTISAFNTESRENADPFSFYEDGFMVWGWLCPRWSWPRIRDGWTWFHNWDINVEHSVRRPAGLISLTPSVCRVKNIGMQGINFNVHESDSAAHRKFYGMYTPERTFKFAGKEPRLVPPIKRLQGA